MNNTVKPFIIAICLFVMSFFVIETFGKGEYRYYAMRRDSSTHTYYDEEITIERYNKKSSRASVLVKREKQFNYKALFISIAVGAFSLMYKTGKKG